ncbi:MAG: NADPH-dependent F420 reductase [Chloroflexi bacterium CFX4]|nr:NADPH-dependent F420 reductase [Chloroflexi bacterium CFX4]MDL1923156.1 NADPH-dependent F420 reductase [Chloroflexi bacterium CFX3]
MTDTLPTLAVIGGTGKEGAGLALRWAHKGYPVIIGSRDAERAAQKAAELNTVLGNERIRGMANAEAAAAAQIIVLSVPYSAHADTITSIKAAAQGKLFVDVTVPINAADYRTVYVPEGKSACVEAQAALGESVKVVAAFQNVSAVHLKKLDHGVDCDVLVCGDDSAAKDQVIGLVEAIGMRGIDAGALMNAVAVEALTPVLLYINGRYKVKGAGIRITGFAPADHA